MQAIDEEKKKEVITFLEQVKKRPLMYIGKLDADLISNFLWAFNTGCLIMRGDDGARSNQSLRLFEMREQYILERGWQKNAKGPTEELRKKGLSEEEIIQELVEIEIEIWKRL